MKTLYRQFISATIIILVCSVGIGFALANVVYFTFTKEKVDEQNVETAWEVVRILENLHGSEEAMHAYLSSIGKLGYQVFIINESGDHAYFGKAFKNEEMPDAVLVDILDGEVYHGMQDFSGSFLMMNHFSNDVQNTVGVPFSVEGEQYGLFLRPNNKMLFSDIHTVLAGFVVAIAIVSITGVVLMTRQLIRPITQLTEATKAVSKENFHYTLDISRKDEIGELAKGFNLMQQQLAHNDEARKAFISNVSHDFQSPLMNIQGYADLLRGDEVDEKERLEYLAIIDRESKRLSNLTKQLLLITSLDQATYPLKFRQLRIDDQIKDIIRKYRWRLSEEGIELSYKLEEASACADEELLVNVWDNLLSNAIKYNSSGGSIFITCHRIDDEIEIVFRDTGIGMSPEAQEQVFERFFRVDEARKKDGTGLGLAIVKQVVALHGGVIRLESKLGTGSTFTIRLPIERR
ncbi:MAG: ATP-binding protein [Lysinibacillus sp.]